MLMLSKSLYSIGEVAEMLQVTIATLRWWEKTFPMFKPNRLPSGLRRFTREDIKMASRIKELLYIKGLSIDAAVKMMNKTYRSPHYIRPECTTLRGVLKLLDEVEAITEDAHALAKIRAIVKFLNTLRDGKN